MRTASVTDTGHTQTEPLGFAREAFSLLMRKLVFSAAGGLLTAAVVGAAVCKLDSSCRETHSSRLGQAGLQLLTQASATVKGLSQMNVI